MSRQFTTRRRFGSDLSDGLNHGYDEYLDGRPTGRIVLGWRTDAGEMVVDYAPADYQPAITPRTTPAAPPERPVAPLREVPPPTSTPAVAAASLRLTNARETDHHPQPEVGMSFDDRLLAIPPEDRYFLVFSWHYGEDRLRIDGPAAAKAARQHLETTFRGFSFGDWRVVHEVVRVEDLGWPR